MGHNPHQQPNPGRPPGNQPAQVHGQQQQPTGTRSHIPHGEVWVPRLIEPWTSPEAASVDRAGLPEAQAEAEAWWRLSFYSTQFVETWQNTNRGLLKAGRFNRMPPVWEEAIPPEQQPGPGGPVKGTPNQMNRPWDRIPSANWRLYFPRAANPTPCNYEVWEWAEAGTGFFGWAELLTINWGGVIWSTRVIRHPLNLPVVDSGWYDTAPPGNVN